MTTGGKTSINGSNIDTGNINTDNVSIGNGNVTINKNGILLNNGAKVIGEYGMFTNLQFIATGLSETYGNIKSSGEYYMLGFVPDYVTASDKYDLFIDVSVPDNFTIVSAYIVLRHIPYSVSMSDGSTVYGYTRNVKCYLSNMEGDAYVEGYEQSEYSSKLDGISYDEISECFDNSSNSFTASVPSSTNLKVTQITSKDIGSKIKKHCRIKVATTNSIPSEAKNCFAQTGWVYAQLNVYGYMQYS